MIVETTPTTKADTEAFFPRAADWRIKALTVRIDGEIKGIGGIAILPNGAKVAFLEAKEEDCKKYRMALMRATKKFFRELDPGTVKLCATCDASRESTPRWLEHLGFKRAGVTRGEEVWQWRA